MLKIRETSDQTLTDPNEGIVLSGTYGIKKWLFGIKFIDKESIILNMINDQQKTKGVGFRKQD